MCELQFLIFNGRVKRTYLNMRSDVRLCKAIEKARHLFCSNTLACISYSIYIEYRRLILINRKRVLSSELFSMETIEIH